MTRNEWTTLAALLVAVATFSAAFGVAAAAAGMTLWMAVAMSAMVYAGASQLSALGVLAAGGSPLFAIITVWLVNLRFLPLGLSMPRQIATSWPQRLLAAQVLVDPLLLVNATTDEHGQRTQYWITAPALYLSWQAGTVLGFLSGAAIPDPTVLGLDVALPAAFVALIVSWRHHGPSRRAAAGGMLVSALAVLTTSVTIAVPASILGALAGIGRSRTDARPPQQEGDR